MRVIGPHSLQCVGTLTKEAHNATIRNFRGEVVMGYPDLSEPTHALFLIGCLNPCLQGTNVCVVSPLVVGRRNQLRLELR